MITSKATSYLTALCLCGALIGCSEERPVVTAPDDEPDVTAPDDPPDVPPPDDQPSPFASIVSNPVRIETSASVLGGAPQVTPAPTADVAFISLAPGTIPDGIEMQITNLETGFSRVDSIVSGGLDPVAVPARAGERLELVATLGAGGTVRAELIVPERRRPRVVRTVPTKGKRDVPLNTTLLVVFSEPLDVSTVTSVSVQLVSGDDAIPVRLDLSDADRLVLTVVPEQPLAPATTYTLVVSNAIQDLDGDALEEEVRADFGTAAADTESVPVAETASIRIETITTGSEPDGDGYWIGASFLGSTDGLRIPANGSVTMQNVPVGDHYVWIDGVARHCLPVGDIYRAITARPGTTGTVRFEVDCAPTTAIRIGTVTSGADPDADGYVAHVQGPGIDRRIVVPPSGFTFADPLLTGEHTITLSGVAANCEVSGPNPQTMSVPTGDTVAVDFPIDCAPATQIAYVGSTDWSESNLDIWVVGSNGAGARPLTTHPAADVDPDWSPDGRIAFRSDRDGNAEIYVMHGDGSAPTRLTNHPASDYEPAWSPDGSKIAFVSERDGNPEIYVMNADGSGVLRLTSDAAVDVSPSWSPDGGRIAFRSERFGAGSGEITVMNADGSGVVRLTFDGADDSGPAWSPDGSTIAFARLISCDDPFDDGSILCQSDIFTMNPDGSAVQRLAGVMRYFDGYPRGYYADDDRNPAWSPDGRKIAIGGRTCVSDGHCHPSSLITVITLGAHGYADVIGTMHARAISPTWRR